MRDALIQSAIIAEGSADAALREKQYNRGVCLYKIFYEALIRLLIQNINDDIAATDEPSNWDTTKKTTREIYDNFKDDKEFENLYREFLNIKVEWGRNKNNTLRKFWLSFIDMVDLLLNTIYAVRSGSWLLLLECIREIIPFTFAYDHINYARYLTPMLGDMLQLEVDFPEVYEQFIAGNFAAQLSDYQSFSRSETDKVIEMTINKESKSAGGTTGFSTNVDAVRRWEVNASYRSALMSCIKQHVSYKTQKYQHQDLRPSRIKKDEADIQAVISVLTDTFVHPFSESTLVSVSTGIVATEDVAKDLMSAQSKGTAAMETFILERLGENPKLSIFDTIKKSKLSTFANLQKKKVCKVKGKEILLKSTTDLFGKITIIAQKRSIDLKRLFQYPLGPLPLSLAAPDGTLKKSTKSVLLHKLEGKTEPVATIPADCALIVDGMACVRQMKTAKKTYSEFSSDLLKFIIVCSKTAKRIDVVFDVYIENSIKDVERNRRSHGELSLKQIVPSAEIIQWNLLLSSNENKNKLISFIVNQWKHSLHLIGEKQIYVTSGQNAFQLNSTEWSCADELYCDHQEADTRMFLHAKHASQTCSNIVLYTPDTDVFIMALSNVSEIEAHMYMLTGVKNARRIIDVNAVSDNVQETLNKTECCKDQFLDALVGFHCFTGCDTISAFSGRGKLKPLSLMCKSEDYVEAFSALGREVAIDDEAIKKLERFVCHMYGKRPDYSSPNVNILRYALYCQKGGKASSEALPPCADVLRQHINRANYRSFIWRKSTVDKYRRPSSTWMDFG